MKIDYLVWPGIVEVVETGERIKTGTKNALAHALMISAEGRGEVIQIHGNLGHINLCTTGNANGKDDVYRKAPITALIVGGNREARIRGMDTGEKGGGYEYIGLRDLTLDARGRQVGTLGFMDSRLGALDYENVTVLSDSKTKWGVRIHGWSKWLRIVNCVGMGGGQEHFAYVDHTWGVNPATGLDIEIRGNRGRNWKRTMAQVVTRKFPGGKGGPSRPAATGKLLITDNEAYDCGAHGAYNFTVAGWPLGEVVFRDNHGESKHKTGLFVAYKDFKQEDLVDPEGYGIGKLTWAHNVGIYPNGDREVNEIGSVNHLEMKVGDLNGAFNLSPNKGVDFSGGSGAGDPCNVIELHSRVDPNDWNWQDPKGQPMPKPFNMGPKLLTPDEVRTLWVH